MSEVGPDSGPDYEPDDPFKCLPGFDEIDPELWAADDPTCAIVPDELADDDDEVATRAPDVHLDDPVHSTETGPERVIETGPEHATETGSDFPGESADYDLAGEAKEDLEQGASPALDEILIDLQRVSQPTRQDCTRLIVRIKLKGAAVLGPGGGPAQQSLLLNLLNDLLMCTETVESATAADATERELLEEIGRKLKKKVGLRVWSMLSKLGKVQEWTVHGDVGISIFGMLTGSGGLSITFGRL